MPLAHIVLVVTVLASATANPTEALSGMTQLSRAKRQLGSEQLQDPNDPQYKKLAEESYGWYREHHLDSSTAKDIRVLSVTRQVVQGFVYHISFTALHTSYLQQTDILECDSKVLLNINGKKEFTVDCWRRDEPKLVGAPLLQDPNDPSYKRIAQVSLQKYRLDHHGIPNDVKSIKVYRVTTQLVDGIITDVDFAVSSGDAGDMMCHSSGFDKPWQDLKSVTVDCKSSAVIGRQGFNTDEEKDPNDPEYNELAKESYDKYYATHNDPKLIPKQITVTRATYQVVAGSIKRINFVVTTIQNFTLICHSEVFEQQWINKKDITVNCKLYL